MDKAITDAARAKFHDAELTVLHARLINGEKIEVIAKIPTWGEATMYREELAKPAAKGQATVHFVTACIVWPEPAPLHDLFEKRPFLVESWAEYLQKRAGITEEVTATDF